MPTRAGPGRTALYCSPACRVRAHRARRALPAELVTGARWVRADGKRPITITGAPASSTNPATWSTYHEVLASSAGDGYGVMLGSGLACWDLDHCLDGDELAPWAREVLESIDSPLWIERSMSGTGLHIFVAAAEEPGRRSAGVEYYARRRFIRFTGDKYGPRGGS